MFHLPTLSIRTKLIFVLSILIGLMLLSLLPIRQFLAYQLHISNDPTTSCCRVEDVLSQNGSFDENASVAFFDGLEVDYPKTSLAESNKTTDQIDNPVLGVTTNSNGEEKWIEVSLDQQKLRAWEGNNIVREFSISSGKWSPTPKGTFYIWMKTRFQRMVGGSKDLGTFYDLPNVPNNMFFYQGYGIHGAYWHNNFGHPMSHGCVNTPVDQSAWLFEWSGPHLDGGQNYLKATADNPGTKVFIH